MAALTLPFVLLLALGVWRLMQRKQRASDRARVEALTVAANACVSAVRGDAPEAWGLSRALEHMSRMGRVSADPHNPAFREERQRFRRLSAEAAAGCAELGRLVRRAHRGGGRLYVAVPASLAQAPLAGADERWFRRLLPETRGGVLALTRQVRVMDALIQRRRRAFGLSPSPLAVDGRRLRDLARIIEVAGLPRDVVDRPRYHAWPLEGFALILLRGSLARVPCDTRHVQRLGCYRDFLQTVSYGGEVGPQRALERPDSVRYWIRFAPTPDGSLWGLGVDAGGHAMLGRYRVGSSLPELTPIALPKEAATRLVPVRRGLAVVQRRVAFFVSLNGRVRRMRRRAVGARRLFYRPGVGGPSVGVRVPRLGRLSLFGGAALGWTSRLSPRPRQRAQPADDVLLRVVDAHSDVREIVSLSAHRSGKTVALLRRFRDYPDAVLLSRDLGRTWVSD